MTGAKTSFSERIYRRAFREDTGRLSLDVDMLSVLLELDGRQNVETIASKLQQPATAVGQVIARLAELRLVEKVDPVVDPDFLDQLRRQLALAVGPIAEILIEDAILDLGHELGRFPARQAAELVEITATEIKRKDRKAEFTRTMLGCLQSLNE
jgi:DNA-binding Lrp family transcriptional regulator